MRRLYLFRHAKTEAAEPGQQDRSRALVERGRKDAGAIGAYMATHALIPDKVLLSPATRVQETWQYLATNWRPALGATTVERIYNASSTDLLDAIANTDAAVPSLMIVGHNPTLQDVGVTLIASGDIDAREALRERLPTAGLVVIDFPFDDWSRIHPQSGRLERFVTPKSIEVATK